MSKKQVTTRTPSTSPSKYIDPGKRVIQTRKPGSTNFVGGSSYGVSFDGLRGKYHFGMLPDRPMDEIRAQRQSNWDRAGNAVVRLFGSTALKAAQSVGYLGGLVGVGNEGELGKDWISEAADNWLIEWAEGAEQSVKDTFPIYKTKAYHNSTVFGNLTKPEFWTDDVVDGLAFMLQAQMQGMGVGLVGRSIGLSNKFAKILSGSKGITKDAAQLRRYGDVATRAAFMTSTEAMFEAKGVRDAVLTEFRDQVNPATGQIYTPQELSNLAAQRAADAYSMNLLALAPSNYLEAGFLFKKLPSATRAKDIILDKGGKAVRKQLKGFGKFADSYPGRILSGIGKGGAAEGLWEENIQYSIEKLNTAEEEAGKYSEDWYERMGQKFGEGIPMLADLSDPHRGKAVLLGSIIGSPMAVMSNVREKLERDKNLNNFIGDINKRTEDLSSLFMRDPDAEITLKNEDGTYTKEVIYTDPVSGETYEKEKPEKLSRKEYEDLVEKHGGERYTEEGKVILDEQGKPMFNLDVVDKLSDYLYNDSALQDLIDLELSTKSKQQKSAEVFQHRKLANWALAHFRAGVADLAIQKLESYRDAEAKDVAQFGYDPTSVEDVNTLIDKRINQVRELQDLYDSVSLGLLPSGMGKKDAEDFRKRQTALYNLSADISILNELQQDLAKDATNQASSIARTPELVPVNDAIAKYRGIQNNLTTLVQTGAKEQDVEAALKELEKAGKEVQEAKKLYNQSIKDVPGKKEISEDMEAEFLNDQFNPKLAKYHNTLVKQGEIADLITRSQQKFNSFMDPVDGQANFNNYQKTKTGRAADFRLPLDDKTSVGLYTDYEKSRIKFHEFRRKRKEIVSTFFTFATQERIEQGEPAVSIIDDINSLKDQYRVTDPNVISQLANMARHRLKELDNYLQDEELQNYLDLNPQERVQFTEKALQDRLDPMVADAEQARESGEAETLLGFLEYLDENGVNAYTDALKPITDDRLKRDVADEYLDLVEGVTNPNFNNLPFTERLLRDLRNLKRIMSARTDGVLETPAFRGFNKTIDAKIAQLEEVERTLREKIREEEARLEQILFDQADVIFKGFGIDTEQSSETGEIVIQPDMQELWDEILDKVPEAGGIAADALEGGFTVVYADILATKISQVARQNKEFFTFINKKADAVLNDIADNDLDNGGYLNWATNKEFLKNRYTSNPRSEIAQLVRRTGNATIDTTQANYEIPEGLQDDSPVKKYLSHFNMSELLRGVQPKKDKDGNLLPQTGTEVRLEKLARAHLKAEAMYELKKGTRSRYAIPEALVSELQSIAVNNNLNKKNQGNHNPSNEQIAAIRELQRWFMKENPPREFLDEVADQVSRFDNFGYFKAPAGAGKTNVVARWLVSILKISPHELLVGAKNAPAAREIQKSLKPNETKEKTAAEILQDLENKTVTDELKLIILDEAGALDNASVEGIADKVKELNDQRSPEQLPIKVLIMGDPNQIVSAANYQTKGTKPIVPIEQYVGNGIKDAYHITRITPTTKTFRSPVEPITDFQDMFIDQYFDIRNRALDVRSTVAEGSTPGEEANPLYGVYGTSEFEGQVKKILDNVDPENPMRSRVIITTPEKVEYYASALKSYIDKNIIAVVDYENAQGLTIDEVYLDIPRAKGEEITTYNTGVYTGASRARYFLMVTGFNTNNVEEANIPQHAEDALKVDEQVNAEYEDRVRSELETVKKYFDAEVLEELDDLNEAEEVDEPSSSQQDQAEPADDELSTEDPTSESFPLIDESADITEQESFNEEPFISVDVPPSGDPDGNNQNVHKAKFPTNRHLSNVLLKDGTEMPAIEYGDDVYYVATRRNNEPLVVMMVPYTTPQGRKLWREVGSLRPQEELPEGLKPWFDEIKNSQLKLNDIAIVNFRPSGVAGDTYITKTDIEKTYIEDSARAVGARTVIGKGTVTQRNPIKFVYDHTNNQPYKNKKELVDNITEAFIKDMWEINYGKQGWTEEARQKALKSIRAGARIRIFTKKTIQAEKRGPDMDPTFNLKPGIPYLVIDNFKYPNATTSTRPFYIQLAPKKLNLKDNIIGVGTSVYNEFLTPISKGTLEKRYRNAGLIPLIAELEKVYAKAGYSNFTLGTEAFNNITHALALGRSAEVAKEMKIQFKATPTMKAIADRIDALLYEREEVEDGKKPPKPKAGPAQKILNAIAKSNLDAGDILLRTVAQGADKKFYFTGKAIMPQNLKARSLENPATKAFIDRNVERALRAGETQEQAEKRSERIQNMTQAGFTLAQLKEIFSHEGNFDSNTKQDFGLRTPLNAPHFNRGSMKIENFVDDTFQGVRRSALSVEVDTIQPSQTGTQDLTSKVKQPAGKTTPTTSLGDAFRSMTGRTKLKGTNDIGTEKITVEEAYQYAKKRIPGLTRDQFKLIDEAQMLVVTEGREAWGAFRDGIIYLVADPASGKVHTRVVRHEVFHRVFHMNFSAEERSTLLNQAREEYGLYGVDNITVEEKLADEFMKWKKKRSILPQWLEDLFNTILRAINFFNNNKLEIENVFDNIERGQFSESGRDAVGVLRTKMSMKDYGSDPQVYRRADNIMRRLINDILVGLDPADDYFTFKDVEEDGQGGYINVPASFEEGLGKIYSQIPAELEAQHNFTLQLEDAIKNAKNGVATVDGNKISVEDLNSILLDSRLTERALAALSHLPSFNNYIQFLYNNKNVRIDRQSFKTKVQHHDDKNTSLTGDEAQSDEDNADERYRLSQAGLDDVLGDGLQAHIKSSDEFNPEEKLSQRVKNYFASIPYTEGGSRTAFVPFRNAIVSLYQVLDNIVWSNVDFEKGTGTIFDNIKRNLKGPKGRALRDKLINLINTATEPAELPIFRFEAVGGDEFIAMYDMTEYTEEVDGKPETRVGKSIEGMTFKEIVEDSRNLQVVPRESGESMQEFFQAILDRKIPGMKSGLEGMRQLTTAFRKFESAQILAETAASLGSMYRKNPKRGTYTSSTRGNNQQRRYFEDNDRGTHRTSTTSTLRNYVQTKYQLQGKNYISKRVKDMLKKASPSIDEMQETISTFYKNIGILRPEEPVHVLSNVTKKFEDLKGLVASIDKVGSKQKIDGVLRKATIEDIVWGSEGDLNNSARFKSLASGLSENSIREVPSNYIRPDGVKVYMYTPSSYAVETLLKVTRASRLPIAHAMRPYLYKHNPFLIDKRSAAKLNFHNGLNNLDTGAFSIYKNENADQFVERVFHNGFVATINMQSKNTGTYDQFLYIPGEKSNIHSATVPIRSDQEVKNLVKQALTQEMNRPNPKENPRYRVENYSNPKKLTEGNWTKSYMAGLENKSTPETLEKDVKTVMAAIDQKAEDALDRMVRQVQTRNKTAVKVGEITRLYDKLENYLPKDVKIVDSPPTKDVDFTSEEYIQQWKDYLRPAFKLFYQNNYVNGHFVNQLIISDMAFFKGPEDIVKRLDVFWAPGLRGITHETHKDVFGNPTFKIGIMKDLGFTFSKEMWPEQKRIIGEKVESYTDAQGYFLPERRMELYKMFGTGMKNRSVLKPAFAAIDKYGIPRAVKYSETELTNKLAAEMPEFEMLRRSLRIAGLDETVFETGFKVGKPNTVANPEKLSIVTEELLQEKPWLAAMGIEVGQEYIEFPPESIVELRNEDWRIQLNPIHHLNSSTKNPSQLTWMVNLRGNNKERQDRMYQLMADHMSNARSKIAGALRLREKYFGTESETKLRNLLASNLREIPGLEMQADLITAKNNQGKYVMDLNAPFIAKKMSQQLSSIVTKNIVTIKYKGTNLVLQSAFGVENDLKYDPETGIAEVYMPDIYEGRFTEGEVISGPMAMAFGFRLPSTDIHSSITLKIKKFLPTEDNIVIAPKEIVFFHGSDYDVDKLYAIRYEVQGDPDPYNNKRSPIGEWLVDDQNNKVLKKGLIPGIDKDGNLVMIGDQTMTDFLKDEIFNVRNTLSEQKNSGVDIGNRPMLKYLQELQRLYPIVLRNELVHLFQQSMTAKETRDYLFSPINTYRFTDGKTGIVNMLENLNDRFKKDNRDMNDIMDQLDIRMDINIAEGAIGSTANFMKSMGHMFAATTDNQDPKVAQGLEVVVDGGVYDSYHLWERTWDKEKEKWKKTSIALPNGKKINPQIWETLDSMAQLALDNLKIQALNTLNYNHFTLKAYLSGIAMGIPAETVVLMMNQPVIGKNNFETSEYRKEIQRRLKLEGDAKKAFSDKASITTEKLKQFIKQGKPLSEMTDNELAFQYNVLIAFQRLSDAGARTQAIAKFTNVLKELPPNFYDLQDKMGVIDDIYKFKIGRYGQKRLVEEAKDKFILKDGFEFPNVDILSLPHLNEAYKVLKMIKTVEEKTFKVNDPRVVRLSKMVSPMFNSDAFREEIGTHTTANNIQEKIRYEFLKYILTGLEYKQDGINVNFDTSNEAPYEYKRDGETHYVGGAEAWAQRFIDQVKELEAKEREKDPDMGNHFILDLNIHADPKFASLNRLGLPDLGQADAATFEQYRLDFERLGDENGYTQLQFDFLKYIVITQGLEWQASSYATVLPPNLYSGLSQALSTELDRLFEDAGELEAIEKDIENVKPGDEKVKRQPAKIDAYEDNFKIQIASSFIQYMDRAPYSTEEGSLFLEDNKTNQTTDTGIVWDQRYRYIEGIKYPEFIKDYFGNNLLWKAYQPEGEGATGDVLYQRIARRTAHNYYQYPKSIEQNPYKMEDYLDPRVRTVETTRPNQDRHKVYKVGFEQGDQVFLKDYSDNSRSRMIQATIAQVENKGDDKFIVIDPKTRTEVAPPAEDKNQFDSASSTISSAALDYTLENLKNRFAIDYEKVSDPDNKWFGRFRDGKVYINTAFARADTPFHEYLHPFIAMIKAQNRPVYDKLVEELLQDRYGQEVLARIRKSPKYQETLAKEEDIIEEAIVTLTAELAAQRIGTNTGGPLLKLLKDIIRLITNAVRNLVGDVRVPNNILRPKDLLTTTTMRDIADVLALSDLNLEAFDGQARDVQRLPKLVNGKLVYTDRRNFYVDDAFSMLEDQNDVIGIRQMGDNTRQLENMMLMKGVRLHENEEYYVDSTGRQYNRLTQWVKNTLSDRPSQEQIAELSAQAAFKREKLDYTDPTAQIDVKGVGNMSYDDYIAFKLEQYETAAAQGRYVHLKVESFMATDPIKKREVELEMSRMRSEEDIDPRFSAWLDQRTFAQILSMMDVNLPNLDATVDVNEQDHVATEIALVSEALGIGTRVDMLVEHSDGSFSIHDWKSGNGFYGDRNFINGLLKWGDQQINIEDSNLDRAKLEVVLRAVMIREAMPEAQFRNLNVAHLNRKNFVDIHGIDLRSNLMLIKDYLYETNREAHNALQEKGVFKADTYGAFTKRDLDLKDEDRKDHEDNIEYYTRKLQELQLAYPNANSTDPSQGGRDTELRKEMAYYTKRIQELQTAPGGFPPNGEEMDIGWIQRWFGNVYSVKNKFIQNFSKLMLKRKDDLAKEIFDLDKEFKEKVAAVKKEYDESKGISLRSVTNSVVAGYNYKDIFGFAWTYKDNKIDKQGWYMTDVNDPNLSTAQKELLIFMKEKMKNVWEEVMHKEVPVYEGDPQPLYKIMGLGEEGAELEDDFMPRVFMGFQELWERFDGKAVNGEYRDKSAWMRPKAIAEHFFSRRKAQFLSDYKYVAKGKDGRINTQYIPVKYRGTDAQIAAEDHTFDIQQAFTSFMTNMLTKKHMDDMIGVAEGLKVHLTMLGDENSKQFENSINFIEDQVLLNVLDARRRNKYFTKTWSLPFSNGQYVIDPEQILMGLKTLTTWSSMWLKPVQGTANWVLITMLNHKDAVKGSIAQGVGIEPEDVDYTLADYKFGEAQWANLQKDLIVGNADNNKLYNISKKLRFLTDNYDYKVNREDVLVTKGKMWRETHLYVFHQIGEEYGNYTLLAAQLRHMKNPATGKSLWDSYDNEGNWIGGTRFKKLTADNQTEEVTELTSEEITKMKRVTQRIHGSYRQEERSAIELYALGKWLLQFKKYLPQLMLNLYTKEYQDQSLGAWKPVKSPDGKTVATRNGETVYKWTERTTNGKLWVMLDLLNNMRKFRKIPWSEMDNETRQSVIDMAITLTTIMSWLVGTAGLDDELKKHPLFKRAKRIFVEDIAQGASPVDLLRNLTNPVPVLTKMYNLSEATYTWLVDGVVLGDRTRDGRIPGATQIRKQTPGFSTFVELEKYFGDSDVVNEGRSQSATSWLFSQEPRRR